MARAKKSKPTTATPFWGRLTLGERVGTVLAILAIVVGVPSFFKDCRGNQESVVEEKVDVSETFDPGCGFPAHFVRDTLYVLITRFEDFENENDTECWGRNIERKIDELVQKRKMPVRFCYRDDVSPNQSYEANRCRDQFHADLIIWGKLKNAGPDCTADELCLEFEISDTLTLNAGGQVRKSESKYESNVSSSDIQKNLFSMNGERFDKWLTGMFDLKIGKRLQTVQEQFQEIFAVDESLYPKKKAEAYVNSGSLKASLGRHDEAIADYDKAIAIDPKYLLAYFERGAAKGFLGRHFEAIVDYEQAINIDSKSANVYNYRGYAKINLGRYSEAIADYDKAIAIDPKFADAYYNRGYAKIRLSRYAESITDYDKAIAIDPKFTDAYISRGIAKRNLGRYAESIADYDQAIAIDPKYALAYSNRGIAKRNLGRYAEAIADYDQAITMDPKYALAYSNRGIAKRNLSRYAEAIADYDQAIAIDPKYVSAYNNRGNAKIDLGRYPEAAADFDQAIAIDPKNTDAYDYRGYVKIKLGRYTEAIADYDQVIAIDPKYASPYYNRAFCKRKNGQYRSALSDYFYSIWLDPFNIWGAYLIPFGVFFLWKFKTINRFLLRLFQALKKRLHRA